MKKYVPFLISKNNETYITPQMELAAAFIYFDLNKTESIKSLFAKQQRENAINIVRGFYPLKAKLFSQEDRSFCVYDTLNIMGNAEIGCSLDLDDTLDISRVKSLDVREKTEEIKKMSTAVKSKEKTHIDDSGLIHSFSGMGEIFKGRSDDELRSITMELNNTDLSTEYDISIIQETLSRLQKSIDGEISIVKDLCELDDESFKDSVSKRNNIYDEFREKIYQMDKEISDKIAEIIIERQNKIRDVEKIYSDKKLYGVQDYIFNKNKYDIAKIYGNEIEMGIYERSMGGADDKVKLLAREESEEIKKVEKYYDTLLDNEKRKLEETVSEREVRITESEEPYNKLHISIDDLKKSIGDDISFRRGQIEKIKSWFTRLDSGIDSDSVEIYIPFYAALYGGDKYKIFCPHALEEKNQIISLLSGIAGKILQPFGDRNIFFTQLFERLQEYINSGGKEMSESIAAYNLLYKEDVCEMVEKGLKELASAGYLSDKNLEKLSPDIRSMFLSQHLQDNH